MINDPTSRPVLAGHTAISLNGGRKTIRPADIESFVTDDPTYDTCPGRSVPAAAPMLHPVRMVPPVASTAAEPRPGRRDAPAPIAATSPARGGVAVIGPARIIRSPLSGKNSSDLGLLTHTLVSTHAPLIAGGLPQDLVPRMYELASGLLDANSNRRRVLAMQAASLAHRYLTRLALSTPWELLGVEHETGNGPVDVAWVHSERGRVMRPVRWGVRRSAGSLPGLEWPALEKLTGRGRHYLPPDQGLALCFRTQRMVECKQ